MFGLVSPVLLHRRFGLPECAAHRAVAYPELRHSARPRQPPQDTGYGSRLSAPADYPLFA